MIAKVVLLLTIVAAAHSQILAPGLVYPGSYLAGRPLLLNNGIYGASPLALSSGIVSPIGLRSAVLSNGMVTLIKK